jgi:hypothetical protein
MIARRTVVAGLATALATPALAQNQMTHTLGGENLLNRQI